MRAFIEKLSRRNVHTPKLAIARFLLAFGVLLTLLFNDPKVVANHGYTYLPGYVAKPKTPPAFVRKVNIFYRMDPARAKVVVILLLLVVMTGFAPQITCFIHFWVSFCIYNYYIVYNGGDEVAVVLSFLLIPLCITDRRLNQWKREEAPPGGDNIVASIALFAIQVQAALLYLDAGISKLYVREWQEGTSVYYYTSHYRLGAPDWLRRLNELITLTPLVLVLSWGVIIFELLLFACLFAPARVKRPFFILAVIFHFLIIVDFGLITFFMSMLALLILFLDDDDLTVRLLDGLKRKLRRKPAIA